MQAWRGNAASAEAEITLALDSAAALPRIIERGGQPIGYAHAVEIGQWSEPPPAGCLGTVETEYFLSAIAGDRACEAVLAALSDECLRRRWRWRARPPSHQDERQRVLRACRLSVVAPGAGPLLGLCWLMLKERLRQLAECLRRRAARGRSAMRCCRCHKEVAFTCSRRSRCPALQASTHLPQERCG